MNHNFPFISVYNETFWSSTTWMVGMTVLLVTVVSLIGTNIYYKKQRNDLVDELETAQAKLRYLQDKLQTEVPYNTPVTIQNSKSVHEKKEIRIFMDGAFDLLHFGHMNAFRLARSLGTHLIVGVNSDESITKCKGPPLMNDEQRLAMVQACKFVDDVVPDCPYIMNEEYLSWVIRTYRIDYVVHGDDPCFVDGKDVYASAKGAGKFRTIPRTAGVSTTDIVGRMLLLTKEHHFYSHMDTPEQDVSSSNENYHHLSITTETPSSFTISNTTTIRRRRSSVPQHQHESHPIPHKMMLGQTESRFLITSRMLQLFSADIKAPSPHMRVIYIDGGWDLFHPGHVSILGKAKEVR
jgi:ethanolamine-phosphate cytidylyltransferase